MLFPSRTVTRRKEEIRFRAICTRYSCAAFESSHSKQPCSGLPGSRAAWTTSSGRNSPPLELAMRCNSIFLTLSVSGAPIGAGLALDEFSTPDLAVVPTEQSLALGVVRIGVRNRLELLFFAVGIGNNPPLAVIFANQLELSEIHRALLRPAVANAHNDSCSSAQLAHVRGRNWHDVTNIELRAPPRYERAGAHIRRLCHASVTYGANIQQRYSVNWYPFPNYMDKL